MANNRIAYGLAKKYGIDTKGMSPKEVWDALRGHGVTQKNAQEKYSSDGNGGTHEPTEAESKRLKELGVEIVAGLSKRDWARIYHRLGEIERGSAIEKKGTGEMLIPLHKMDEGDVPRLVILGGSYEFPRLKMVIEFSSEEKMFEKMREMEWR